MTIEQLQQRLVEARERVGFGRFDFTFEQSPTGSQCYVTHWYRKTNFSFEDGRSIGVGTIEQCLEKLEDYVAKQAQKRADAEASTIPGLILPIVHGVHCSA